tara:strand:- start:54 stop:872 length:819 start_codon:yes stop_codon:yes gene_type:complete
MIGLMAPSAFAEVNGLREGQWVKYKVELGFYASSPELENRMKPIMMDAFSQASSETDFDPTNVEWIMKKIINVNDNNAIINTISYSLDGVQTETTTGWTDVSEFTRDSISIPTDTTFGDMFELPSPWAPLSVFEIKNSSDDYLFESRKLPNFDYIFLTSDNQTELENARMETNAYLKFEKSTGMLIESDIGMAILFDNGEWVEVYMLLSPLEMSLDGTTTQNAIEPPEVKSQKIPEWVKNIFAWYSQGQISEDEVLGAIKFLVNQGIIDLSE